MGHTRSNDYFSFMAEKKRGKNAQDVRIGSEAVKNTFTQSDVIEFIEEPQMEVTESCISDTSIQRIFGRFRQAVPAAMDD